MPKKQPLNMMTVRPDEAIGLSDLLPDGSRLLLTGTGKQFIERIGIETARQAVLGVLLGENLRTQTEPLTRQRLSQVSAGLIALFTKGCLLYTPETFCSQLSDMAVKEMTLGRREPERRMLGEWFIGLTKKTADNVLRDHDRLNQYIENFEAAIEKSAVESLKDAGNLKMTLGFAETADGKRVELGWKEIARLTSAIGSQTLAIRGSEKSMYGKLFEKLVLGSVLSLLGFERVHPSQSSKTEKVFWLSDSSQLRETDATAIITPGHIALFDIGFIGKGNPEIAKDKLTRFAKHMSIHGRDYNTTTFIIIDRLPRTTKTSASAAETGTEIIQMSMQYWPRDLASKLDGNFGYKHPLQNLNDDEIHEYIKNHLASVPIQEFLSTVSLGTLMETEENEELS